MIPKVVNYVWFGKKDKPDLIKNCIESWKRYLPDYELKEWNEYNFPMNYNKFFIKAYEAKKWAFCSDITRLYALYEEGGIYLDTDAEVFKPLDEFLKEPAFTGFEQLGYPVCATMGAEKGNPIIKEMLDYYKDKEFQVQDDWTKYTTNTVIMSDILGSHGVDRQNNAVQRIDGFTIYPREYFCDKGGYTFHHMAGSWRIMQKRIIIWHGYFCKIGGVETFIYNWCQQLREYYDIKVLTTGGEPKQLARLRRYVDVEMLDKDKTYEAEIVIRNSVWSTKLPENIISTENRIIEMKHANYKYLTESGRIKDQYIPDDRVTEHLACGEFVAKMYKEVTGKEIPYIKNILAPKRKTEKIYRFLSTSRIYDPDKGWNEILQFCDKLKKAKIKFEFNIFSELPPDIVNMDGTLNIPYQEIHVYKPQLDIFDYVADADYVVLFTKSEGLPYSIQEALQYGTPCIVSDVGGCTELIQDEVNGYVVKDLATFEIEKIKKIPKLKAYKGTTADEWCDFLGGAEYVKKPVGEDREPRVKLRAKAFYDDVEEELHLTPGDVYEARESRAEMIVKADYAEYYKG